MRNRSRSVLILRFSFCAIGAVARLVATSSARADDKRSETPTQCVAVTPVTFGAARQVVFSTGFGAGVQMASANLEKGQVSPGRAGAGNFDLTLDDFVARGFALGIGAGYRNEMISGDSSGTFEFGGKTAQAAVLRGRLSGAWNLGSGFAAWLRAGADIEHMWVDASGSFQSDAITLDVDLPFVYGGPPVFVGFGPFVAADITRTTLPETFQLGLAVTVGFELGGQKEYDPLRATRGDLRIGTGVDAHASDGVNVVDNAEDVAALRKEQLQVADGHELTLGPDCTITTSEDWQWLSFRNVHGKASEVGVLERGNGVYHLRSYDLFASASQAQRSEATPPTPGTKALFDYEELVLKRIARSDTGAGEALAQLTDAVKNTFRPALTNPRDAFYADLLAIWVDWAKGGDADASKTAQQEVGKLLEQLDGTANTPYRDIATWAAAFFAIDRATRDATHVLNLTDQEFLDSYFQKRPESIQTKVLMAYASVAKSFSSSGGGAQDATAKSASAAAREKAKALADQVANAAKTDRDGARPIVQYVLSRVYALSGPNETPPTCADAYLADGTIFGTNGSLPTAALVGYRARRDGRAHCVEPGGTPAPLPLQSDAPAANQQPPLVPTPAQEKASAHPKKK